MSTPPDLPSDIEAYLASASFEQQKRLYRVLMEFLQGHRGILRGLVQSTQQLDEQLQWLLTSSRWKVGYRVTNPLGGHYLDVPVAALCREAVDAASGWGSEKSAALGVFVDSLIPPDRVDAMMSMTKTAELLRRHLPVMVCVTRECLGDSERLSLRLSDTLDASLALLDSNAWRIGDFIVNDLVKRVTRSASRNYAWAPENIRAMHEAHGELCATMATRFDELSHRVANRGGFKGSFAADSEIDVLATVSLARRGPLRELIAQERSVTVIVPVYNAFEVLEDCFASLVAHTDPRHSVLLIDDRSTDDRVWPLLQRFASRFAQIQAVQNDANLGFPATVNRGFAMAEGDVVILNSDTEVTARWLEKLMDAAYSRGRVATVTPLTNSGSVFSVPEMHVANELPRHLNLAVAADAQERCSLWIRPDVPTGNGFCMYIRREALDEVGVFDAETFGRGYGEENDFCVRATQKGYVHLIDDATFILHKENASFLDAADENKTRALAAIRERYPDYDARIQDWLKEDRLANLRYTLKSIWEGRRAVPVDSYLLDDARPTLLYVVHDGAGGTVLHLRDLALANWVEYRTLFLRTGHNDWRLETFTGRDFETVAEYEFSMPWVLTEGPDGERMEAARSVVETYSPALVHVHHFMWNAPELMAVFTSRGARAVFSVHDFYSVCPSFNLLDQDYRFCGGTCTEGPGECPIDIKDVSVPNLKHGYVFEWRDRMRVALEQCDALVSFSDSGREIVTKAFPTLDTDAYRILAHGHRDGTRMETVSKVPRGAGMRVLILGSISPSKGLNLVREVMAINRAEGSPFTFYFVGTVHPSFKPEEHGAIAHGAYQVAELPEILAGIGPSVALIPTVWGETFCFTLSECWAAGIPVVASDIGTLHERVSTTGGGWLVDPYDAQAWFDRLRSISEAPEDYVEIRKKVLNVSLKSLTSMSDDYRELYHALLGAPASE